MPDLVASLHRSYHRLVDLALRVDPTSALNRGRHGVREFFLRYLDDGRARALLEGDQDGRRLGFYRYDWSLNQLIQAG